MAKGEAANAKDGISPRFIAWAEPWRATLVLVGAVLAARLLYAWVAGPYTLVEDEAHYWEWSRFLEWSYYSKGPGIAWLIRLATEVMGTSEAAIRTPAALSHAITALVVSAMARRITGDGRVGFASAVVVCIVPVFQAVSMLMTIDGPYLACWAIACWSALVALRRRGRGAWLMLGAALAIGFWFKYTIVLLIPGLIGFAIVHRRELALTERWGRWLAGCSVIALLGLLPVAVWNAQHDWATVRHLLGHAGLPGGDQATSGDGRSINPLFVLEFLIVQLGVVGPMFIAIIAAGWMTLSKRSRALEADVRSDHLLCVWLAAPILLGYGVLALFTRIEGNWPIAGYISLVPLAAALIVQSRDALNERTDAWLRLPESERPKAGLFRKRPESAMQITWDWAIGYGLIAGIVMLRLDVVAMLPFGPRFMERTAARVTGADVRAGAAQAQLEALHERTGQQPFVIAQQYGRASQMAFYLPGHPVTYASSSLQGGRRTQYDEWSHTDLRSPAVTGALLGRPALLIGATGEQWAEAFETIEPIGVLEGESKRGREAFLGLGYVGFESSPESTP